MRAEPGDGGLFFMRAEAVFVSDRRAAKVVRDRLISRFAEALESAQEEIRLLAAIAALPPDLRERAEEVLRRARRAWYQAR